MIFTLLTAAVAVCAFGAILSIALVLGSRGNAGIDDVSMRLNRYGGEEEPVLKERPKTGNPFRDLFVSVSDSVDPVLAGLSYSGKLADELQKADLKLKSAEWVTGILGIGTLVGALAAVRFGNPFWVLAGWAVVWILSGFYLSYRKTRRRRAFDNQLGETITLLSNALKAGYSFAQAMSTVSRSAGPPIGDEFARATREIALGVGVDEALNNMVARNVSEDFDFLVTAVQIQRVVGGNLAEILDTIAYTIRERVRIQGEIRTLTAQARMSGNIIFILPIALAAVLYFISPDYFQPMFHRVGGWIMMGVGFFFMCVGYGLIRKIVQIEV